MMYTAKVSGNFTETQSVEAESYEDAKIAFAENKGETLTRDSATDIEVSECAEVEDENGDSIESDDVVDAEILAEDAETLEPETL